jgi:hypothetical protein
VLIPTDTGRHLLGFEHIVRQEDHYRPVIRMSLPPSATDRKAAAGGRLAGLAYTLGHPELLAQVQTVTGESYAAGARWLRKVAKEDDLPMPPEHLVRVLHALTEGLVLQSLVTPELFPNAVYYAAFDALALSLKRTRSR